MGGADRRAVRRAAAPGRASGGYLIQDGAGDQLLVYPAQGRALPESGNPDDTLPIDYEFGCPAEIFLGATHD